MMASICPGGEKQKVAIARSIYKNASLLIFDEPTSALDPYSEYNIYKQIHELSHDKTVIFISHRLSSCKFCDQIILMDNGTIVDSGTHSELLERNLLYSSLWKAQASYYVDVNE